MNTIKLKNRKFPSILQMGLERIVPVLSLFFALVSCTNRVKAEQEKAEAEAAGRLDEARRELRASRYDNARAIIMDMRHELPTAIDARRRAILLLDSIELFAANDSAYYAKGDEWERLDMKCRFYERKLQEDINAYGGI